MARTQKQKAAQTHAVSLVTLTNPSSPIAEQYRTIRTNIQFASAAGQQIKTIVVTSSGPGEGKSTTAANIAVVFAKSGQRVLLVDADLRKPVIYKTFKLNNASGLSTVLSSSGSVADEIQRTPVDNLSILPSGPKPPNPSELLSSPRMDQILAEARQLFRCSDLRHAASRCRNRCTDHVFKNGWHLIGRTGKYVTKRIID